MGSLRNAWTLALVLVAACTRSAAPNTAGTAPVHAAPTSAASRVADLVDAAADANIPGGPIPPHVALATIGAEAERCLFPHTASPDELRERERTCPTSAAPRDRVLCLLTLR